LAVQNNFRGRGLGWDEGGQASSCQGALFVCCISESGVTPRDGKRPWPPIR
jgi:hypothetical protein